MIKNITKVLVLFLTFIPGFIYSQTNLVYFEDFEVPNTSVLNLNSGNVGSNTGINLWEINSQYIGQPVFPNTISEDSTFGGLITHPDSNYLHIHDVNVTSVSNANFDPNHASDRFTTLGPFCTLGLDTVHFAFYCLCVGNSNSYGQLYYSTDGGTTWTIGAPNYSGIDKWKYEDVTNNAFDNVENLEFGFRWVNGTSTDTATSFGIDDIKLVGSSDPAKYPVNINISQVLGVPTCQNTTIEIEVDLSAALCGQGVYQLQLSDSTGNFSNYTVGGDYSLNNYDLTNFLDVNIPSNTPPGDCYRIRIVRAVPMPYVYSDTSICFEVMKCPNTITTLQPAVVSNPQDTVCIGSVIDVPFLSTGVYVNNTYEIELSDSNGNFNGNNNILGSSHDSQTYPGPPGSVSGKVIPKQQPIPPGCHYYIRVISTNPAVDGSVYGPFCIRDCDVETNDELDIHVCVTPTTGDSIVIPIDINMFDSLAMYAATDSFEIQVLNTSPYFVINTGGLGFIISDMDTSLHVYIPGLNGLGALGLTSGTYYMRIIATNSNEPWNELGTLIHLTIGSPSPVPLSVLFWDVNNTYNEYDIPDTTVCVGTTLFYIEETYNPNSTYEWTLNNNNQWPDQNDGFEDYTGIIFNGASTNYLSVVETNYGCVGPGSDTVEINVLGTPSVTLTGPTQICIGDTVNYSVPLEDQTYYAWSSPTGIILDTANNNLTITFDSVGNQQINIHVVGYCGVADGTHTINVKAYPLVNAGDDTTICQLDTVHLSTTSGAYTYSWSNGATTRNIIVTPDSTTSYIITSTVTGTAGCKSSDTVTVFVHDPQMSAITDSICPRQPVSLDPGISGASYIWSTGKTTQTITVDSPGTYILNFKVDTAVCNAENTYTVIQHLKPGSSNGSDTLMLCPGASVLLDAGNTGLTYSWNTDASTETITVSDTGIYSVTVLNNSGKCVQTAQFDVESENCLLHYPNVFTPNNDGKNDKWFDPDSTYFSTFDVKIFDRWGLLMFESGDCNFQWDGINKQGKLVDDGVYYFIVVASSGSVHQNLHGFVTVLGSKK